MILRVGGWAFRICITPVWSFDSILCTNSFKVGTTGGGGGLILAMSFYYSLRD